MRAGQVVRIRVNPKDCMSALDVLGVAGVPAENMSFSSAVSLAFSSMLEGMRQQGVIPTRDGFEFSQMMQKYLRGPQGQKLAVADAIYKQGPSFQVKPVLPVVDNHSDDREWQEPEVSPEVRRASRMLAELIAKRELAEQSSAVIWSNDDQAEYERYYRIVYPGEPLV